MNLTRQYESIKNELDRAVLDVLASGQYIMGDNVKSFEKDFASYVGVKYAIAVGNGTDALTIALRALDIRPGDEVITCAMSFFSTAEAISQVGAIPVFVDCAPDTNVIDEKLIESAITSKTRAIIPVQLYGYCAEMDEIMRIAKKHNLFVIEDAAQAAGAEYKGRKAGSFGDIGCFSFFPTKNLGCAGDGGMITTNNDELAAACRAYRVHGSGLDGQQTYNRLNNIENSELDFHGNLPKYFNFLFGYNSRLDEMQAAVLKTKLPYLDAWNDKRIAIAKQYTEGIVNKLVTLPACETDHKAIYYVYVIKTKNRDELRRYLQDKGIATGIYFPIPLHLQVVYEYLGYKKGDMPNAEALADHSLAIPMFPELTSEEIANVIKIINEYAE